MKVSFLFLVIVAFALGLPLVASAEAPVEAGSQLELGSVSAESSDPRCDFLQDPIGCFPTQIACGDSDCTKNPTSLQPLNLNQSASSGFQNSGGCCGTESCALMFRCSCGGPLGSVTC